MLKMLLKRNKSHAIMYERGPAASRIYVNILNPNHQSWLLFQIVPDKISGAELQQTPGS